MSYYQKYRPERFGELDLPSVRSIFERILSSGEVAHAYLLVGPKGIGKTSSGRLLTRLVNCQKNYQNGKLNKTLVEPCGECDNCVSIRKGAAVDVLEIDAASHGLVDDVRELKEKVNLAPVSLPKKVYLIDEVHMMSTGAFNALLKTLEEPPENVMFILCTTEANKVPETIVSRCTRINFVKANTAEVLASLKRVAEGEGIEVEDEALSLIAESAEGSFREGHKLLEQLNQSGQRLVADKVRELLRLVSGDEVSRLLSLVDQGKPKEITALIADLEARGLSAVEILKKLLELVRLMIRVEVQDKKNVRNNSLKLMDGLIKVGPKIKISPLPFLPLEVFLVKKALRKETSGRESLQRQVVEEVVVKPKETRVTIQTQTEVLPVDRVAEIEIDNVAEVVDFEVIQRDWWQLVNQIGNASIAGLLRATKPKEIDEKFLTIEVFYKFHKEQLETEAKRRVLEEVIAKMWGPYSIKCVLGEKGREVKVEERKENLVQDGPADEAMAAAVEEIFGA